ncbi:MAG: hypothetical protein A2Y38_13875 [Spirochaetes bacterium GWB1_59_5]|nr:MAG: hypothetical protein A2Y38_13875 [Spirochaetes bacterium GWB1_59_5]
MNQTEYLQTKIADLTAKLTPTQKQVIRLAALNDGISEIGTMLGDDVRLALETSFEQGIHIQAMDAARKGGMDDGSALVAVIKQYVDFVLQRMAEKQLAIAADLNQAKGAYVFMRSEIKSAEEQVQIIHDAAIALQKSVAEAEAAKAVTENAPDTIEVEMEAAPSPQVPIDAEPVYDIDNPPFT